MDKTKLALLMLPLIVLIGMPSVSAFEANESYFLDDNESVSILVEVDANGAVSIPEIFINDELGITHVMDMDNAKSVRVTDDHSFGKIFGKTFDGYYALVLFEIDSNNEVSLKAKVWADDETLRIVSTGEIIPLF